MKEVMKTITIILAVVWGLVCLISIIPDKKSTPLTAGEFFFAMLMEAYLVLTALSIG